MKGCLWGTSAYGEKSEKRMLLAKVLVTTGIIYHYEKFSIHSLFVSCNKGSDGAFEGAAPRMKEKAPISPGIFSRMYIHLCTHSLKGCADCSLDESLWCSQSGG